MQSPQQAPERKPKGNPNWYPGMPSTNPRGRLTRAEMKARVEAKVKELAAELGGERLADWQWTLLREAADELLRPVPVDVEQRIRRRNSIARLLSAVRKGRRLPSSSSRAMSTLEAIKRHARG
jgi:hypothetical protein